MSPPPEEAVVTERDGSRLRISARREVAADDPLFLGHFPDHPILPGVAQLDFVARAIGAATGRETALSAVSAMKLRRPVLPGDTLDLQIDLETDGRLGFRILRGGHKVSQGSALATVVEPGVGPTAGFAPRRRPGGSAFPDPATLLPHAPPARLLSEVLELAASSVVGRAEIAATHPLVASGRAPAFLGLEAAAQAAAVLVAGEDDDEPGPRIGYLVGIRDARFLAPHLPATTPFRVHVEPEGAAAALTVYAVRVEVGAELIAHGTISTFLPQRPDSL